MSARPPRPPHEHPPRAVDVDAARRRPVARGLDQPGEVNDGVDVAKRRDEVVAHDVGADPGGARNGQLRQAPGDADDLLDRRVGAERAQHARPGVAGGADDGDAHQAGSM